MKSLPDGTKIGFSSRYSTKHLLTKPLHYLIQIFTGSKLHHVGIMCDNLLYEAMYSTGVRKIPLAVKLDEIDDCVDVIIFEPTNKLTPSQSKELKIDLENQVGKQYSTLQAFLSILTAILFLGLRKLEPKNKLQFCSKLVFKADQNIYPEILKGILPRTLNPEECKKVLRKAKLIKPGRILRR